MDEIFDNTYFDLGGFYGDADGEEAVLFSGEDIPEIDSSAGGDNELPSSPYDDPAFWRFVDSYLQQSGLDNSVEPMSLSPSSSSYLSTTQLDLFDRILSGGDYRYYIAYRTGSDTYGAVLYACNEVSVTGSSVQLIEPMQFQLYRSYSGSTYYYYYTHTQLSSDSVSLNNNILYYTNIFEGYPLLADQGRDDVSFSKDKVLFFGVFVLLFLVIIMRRRRS